MSLISLSPKRTLGSISIQCTIEEQHTDAMVVTDHPVEASASVSDHAYMQPVQLALTIAWSNSSLLAGLNANYVRDKYQELLALQSSRIPFDVVTGKRNYSNMLITSLGVTTDEKTETTLAVSATLREVIRAQTRVVSVPPAEVQASPQATAATTQTGAVQPKPAVLSPPGTGG